MKQRYEVKAGSYRTVVVTRAYIIETHMTLCLCWYSLKPLEADILEPLRLLETGAHTNTHTHTRHTGTHTHTHTHTPLTVYLSPV